eukprot:Gregarina_sp_Pseudo_9__84@NODE_1057_length_1916_cov_6_067128_g989_i0_p1_GENE_NODE_1057_length_1916_cov_6_067128_g989_i0NODE_1057_length_1916_cov_6_067128_g989_i0_p1_ORF_typecomplete_len467_score37_02_NODE_1057_length_1916_cov_6_067128_g989_i04291829
MTPILESPIYLPQIYQYLPVKDRYKLQASCHFVRGWIRSPEQEKAAMLRVFELSWGFWDLAVQQNRINKTLWADKERQPSTWLEVELQIEFGWKHEQTEIFRELKFGELTWRRVRIDEIDQIRRRLSFLSPGWNRANRTKIPLWQDFAFLLCEDGSAADLKNLSYEDFEAACNCLPLPWETDGACGVSISIERTEPSKIFSRLFDWGLALDLPYHPRTNTEIAAPFLARAAFQDPEFLANLIDVNVEPSPASFLNAIQTYGKWTSEPPSSSSEAESDESIEGVAESVPPQPHTWDPSSSHSTTPKSEYFELNEENISFLGRQLKQNWKVFGLPVNRFWDLSFPLSNIEDPCTKEQLEDMTEDLEWRCGQQFLHFCCHQLTRCEAELLEKMRNIMARQQHVQVESGTAAVFPACALEHGEGDCAVLEVEACHDSGSDIQIQLIGRAAVVCQPRLVGTSISIAWAWRR